MLCDDRIMLLTPWVVNVPGLALTLPRAWVAAVTLASTTAAISLLLRRDRVDLLKMAVNRAPA